MSDAQSGIGTYAPAGHHAPGAPKIRPATNRHANLALLLVAALALLVYCWLVWSPSHFGDGFEYLNMSVAFARHGTPDLRIEDLRAILREYPHNAFLQDLGEKTLDHFIRGQGDFGFSPSPVDGRFYSYHFWLYSLLNAPTTWLCMWLRIPLRNSFLLTNCALFLGFLSVIAFGTANWRFRRKCLLASLALLCGSTFYLNRTSPESMCFSLLAMGLVLLETRRYAWALLAFAAAAQQNPPIGLLAVAAGLAACWQMILDWRTSRSKVITLQAFMHLLPGAIVLIASPLFYFLMFGTPNLIVKGGGSSPALISGYRLESLFLDANQGMVLAMPGIFIALLALLLIGVARRVRVIWRAIMLVGAALAMSIPVLTAPNWNSDCAIIIRYAHWLSAPLIYACAMLLDALALPLTFAVAGAMLLASQAAVLANFGVRGDAYGFVQMSPLATWLLRHHPAWYQPVPEIFVERGMHADGVLRAGYAYFYVQRGRVRLALSRKQRVYAIGSLCHIDQSKMHASDTELEWRYWDLKRYCPSNWEDGFYAFPDPPAALRVSGPNRLSRATAYVSALLPGFGKPEKWGTWTIGHFAALPLVLPADSQGHFVRKWRVALTFSTFVTSYVPRQHVVVLVDDKPVLDFISAERGVQTRSFIAEAKPWDDYQGSMVLDFRIPTVESYLELGLSRDTRRIGIGLISVSVEPLQ